MKTNSTFDLIRKLRIYITSVMKLKLVIIALVVLGLAACTQKTCPTYAEVDTTKPSADQKA
jgi:hypothetical protein